MKSVFKLLAALLLTAACTKVNVVDEHLVVEGWIEDGGYPQVTVSSSLVAEERSWSMDDLSDHILRWATVSVSDGEKTVFLTGVSDSGRFPPYYYTTADMKGVAGRTYTLNVRYGSAEASAVTTLPAKQELTGLKVVEDADGYCIDCSFDAKPCCRYKFFSRREGKDKTFASAYLSMVNGDDDPGEVEMRVNRGYDLLAAEHYKMQFEAGDVVSIRFCTMDEEAFSFWQQCEELTLFSRNPILPITSDVRGNIKGGYGCWIGYGASYYNVEITP